MKKTKVNNVTRNNSKISDFFSKLSESDSKRKYLKSPENTALQTLTNLPEKSTSSNNKSPECKKLKQDENFLQNTIQNDSIRLVKTELLTEQTNIGNNVVSPAKYIKPSSSMKTPTPKKTSSSTPNRRNKTPQSSKKGTPKRLFEKSPRKLEEFNVQVLEDFVKISPSTSNRTVKVRVTPQKVITPGKSSLPAVRTTPAERLNEVTPSKAIVKTVNLASPRIKTKLNFSECKVEMESTIKQEYISTDILEGIFDSSFGEEFSELMLDNLKFDEPQFCKILSVERSVDFVTLKLKSVDTENIGSCKIKGFWCSANFCIGDKISIQIKNKIDGEWVVNNENGWIVYEPDLLISCTSVVGSLFCKRKSVLVNKIPGFDSGHRVMLIGTVVHSLLQEALKKGLNTANDLEDALRNILNSKRIIKTLYEHNLSFDDIKFELSSFIPKIIEFLFGYLNGQASTYNEPGNWKGKISTVDDIEENLWCPQLGIKGKIDVTVGTQSGIMPLEVKTGRASVSLEHRGQVILYIMMMNKFGYNVSSGLLLYLREGVLKEIQASSQEKRDILILRNELAYFLTRKIDKNQKVETLKSPALPEPIENTRACSNCSYNVICTSFLKYENHDISKNKNLKELQNRVTAHLTENHLNYFLHWNTLLTLEAEHSRNAKSLHEIYTISPEARESQGRCITKVKVRHIDPELNGIFEHKFEKFDQGKQTNLTTFGLVEGNYIVISTDNRPAVASGFVTEVNFSSISISIDRNLDTRYKGHLFHLDTYDSNSTHLFSFSSLALLLENTQKAQQLRNIIIDKAEPSFVSKLPAVIAKTGAPILKRLNSVQQRAVLKALCANEYLLIKGMPGTGKSATIIALVQLLIELGKTVLITSHTHSAVDNICARLQKFKVDFIRLGSDKKMDSNLALNSDSHLTKNCSSPEELEEVYNSYKVVAVTCLGSGHSLLSKRTFDVCIVDESTQVVQATVIKPLYAAKTFILIGDPDQLTPVVKNRDARDAGLCETLFERLSNANGPKATVILNLNYRMNKTITQLANILTYKGELQPANEIVANRCLQIPNMKLVEKIYKNKKWLLRALDATLENSVQFIDTGPVWQLPRDVPWILKNSQTADSSDTNYINVHEAAVVVTVVNALIKGGVAHGDIGVIATYRAQVAQISALCGKTDVDVSTVDQFQGRDKNIMIYSCTKSTDTTKTSHFINKQELLEDRRRLTVAITRAKRKLIIVGDLNTLQNYKTFSSILDTLKNNMVAINSQWDIMNEF